MLCGVNSKEPSAARTSLNYVKSGLRLIKKKKNRKRRSKEKQAIIEHMNTLVSLFYLSLLLFTIFFLAECPRQLRNEISIWSSVSVAFKYHVSDIVKKEIKTTKQTQNKLKNSICATAKFNGRSRLLIKCACSNLCMHLVSTQISVYHMEDKSQSEPRVRGPARAHAQMQILTLPKNSCTYHMEKIAGII